MNSDARSLVSHEATIRFGGLHALRDVSIWVPAGTVTGLIGPNGAGKTTLINVLTGFYKPTSGSVMLDRRSLAGVSSNAIRKLGVSRTFQAGRLFRALDVTDNVAVAGVALGRSRAAATKDARAILDLVGIAHLGDRLASTLSYTDQRRVAIARAIMGRPSYLLIDEPAAGMSEHELAELTVLIRRLVAEMGCGVLLIEHNIGMVLDICSAIFVLDGGIIVESGPPEAIRGSARLREAYLGGGVKAAGRKEEEAVS